MPKLPDNVIPPGIDRVIYKCIIRWGDGQQCLVDGVYSFTLANAKRSVLWNWSAGKGTKVRCAIQDRNGQWHIISGEKRVL